MGSAVAALRVAVLWQQHVLRIAHRGELFSGTHRATFLTPLCCAL